MPGAPRLPCPMPRQMPRGAGAPGAYILLMGQLQRPRGSTEARAPLGRATSSQPTAPNSQPDLEWRSGWGGPVPGQASAHLDDHKRQLALQQEEEALSNAVGGVPRLGTGRDRVWPGLQLTNLSQEPDAPEAPARKGWRPVSLSGREINPWEPRRILCHSCPLRAALPSLPAVPARAPTCSMSRMMLMVSSWRKVREQGRLLSCPESWRGERPSEAWAMLVLVA